MATNPIDDLLYMLTYPSLTVNEQLALPALIAEPQAMPRKFHDSTHQLWHCETRDGAMVLKVCDHHAVAQSGFWQTLNRLFEANFPNNLDQADNTYTRLAEKGTLPIPELIASSANRFVLTRFLAGVDVNATQISHKMVTQLANHVSQLHQYQSDTWGNFHAPTLSATDWPSRLQQVLLAQAKQNDGLIPASLLSNIINQASMIQETTFVPIMLDLRWDQLRSLEQGHTLALIDLDAFVIGPPSLELVLLEYVLTAQQFALFKATYTEKNDWPEYAAQKTSYQLLLFLMQVLGETKLSSWMNQLA
jgi:hypothetical protein